MAICRKPRASWESIVDRCSGSSRRTLSPKGTYVTANDDGRGIRLLCSAITYDDVPQLDRTHRESKRQPNSAVDDAAVERRPRVHSPAPVGGLKGTDERIESRL